MELVRYANVSGELMGGEDYTGRQERQDPEQFFTDEHAARTPRISPEYPIHGMSKGDQSYLNFNQIETLGTTDEGPVLVLPTNTPIEFQIASGDVAHSFWIPEFLFKRDAFAHPEANQQQRAFQIEDIEEEGAFVGRCAEMCGTYHAMMNFEVRAFREAFAEYMQFRIDNPEVSNAEALESIGEEPFAVSTSLFNSGRLDTRDMGNREANTVDLNATK